MQACSQGGEPSPVRTHHIQNSEPTHLSRQQILETTARCFQQHGYEGTTIRRIAMMLGCAVGSIYRYFDDKRELLDSVSQQQLEQVADHVAAGGPLDQSVRLYVEQAAAEPQLYRVMFWLACVGACGSPGQSSVPEAVVPQIVKRIVAGWAERLGDADLAQRCWAMVHGLFLLGLSPQAITAAALGLLDRHGADGGVLAQPVAWRTDDPNRPTEPTAGTHNPSSLPQAAPADAVEDICLL